MFAIHDGRMKKMEMETPGATHLAIRFDAARVFKKALGTGAGNEPQQEHRIGKLRVACGHHGVRSGVGCKQIARLLASPTLRSTLALTKYNGTNMFNTFYERLVT